MEFQQKEVEQQSRNNVNGNGATIVQKAFDSLPVTHHQLDLKVQVGKQDWHNSIEPELRIRLAQKIVQAIFPTPDPAAMLDKRMHNVIAYAEKAERDAYEISKSKTDYCSSLIEKICSMHKDLTEKRQQRQLQQTVQGNNQPQNINKSNEITPAVRNQSVYKILQVMFPIMNLAAMPGVRSQGMAFAKRVENEVYKLTNTKMEYDQLLIGKILKLKNELENRKMMMTSGIGKMAPRMAPVRFNNSPYVWQGANLPPRISGQFLPLNCHPVMQQSRMVNPSYYQAKEPPKVHISIEDETKNWRESISSNRRNDSIYRLLQAKYPDPRKMIINEDKEQSVENAKKIEQDIHEKANSLSEYYALLLKKVIEFRKDNNSQIKLKL